MEGDAPPVSAEEFESGVKCGVIPNPQTLDPQPRTGPRHADARPTPAVPARAPVFQADSLRCSTAVQNLSLKTRVESSVLLARCAALKERCPPRQKSKGERLKAKVEPVLTSVTVDYARLYPLKVDLDGAEHLLLLYYSRPK